MGRSLSPKLWLLGSLFGLYYGPRAARVSRNGNETSLPFSALLCRVGTNLAAAYSKASDVVTGLYFTYKTGQLSMAYYRRYSAIDDKYGIQEKVDAWNARFRDGKQQFDAWERENEVGRKILAGLRTAWLVEETGRPQLRIARAVADAREWAVRRWRRADVSWGLALCRGVGASVAEATGEEIFGSVTAGLVGVLLARMLGVFWNGRPRVLGFAAFALGTVFPGWMIEGVCYNLNDLFVRMERKGEVKKPLPKRLNWYPTYVDDSYSFEMKNRSRGYKSTRPYKKKKGVIENLWNSIVPPERWYK